MGRVAATAAFAVLVIAGAPVSAHAGNGAFVPQSFSFDGGLDSIDIGDFGNDSHQDLVYTSSAATRVSLGDGLGGFSDGGLPTSGLAAHDLAVGDFDEDGLDDVLIAIGFNGGPESVTFARGIGDDRFTPTSMFVESPERIAIGDFDNDNHEDFVAVSRDNPTNGITVGTGDGDGAFTMAPFVPIGAAGNVLSDVAVGDVSGDGDEDLLVVNRSAGSVAVFTGINGTAGFNAPTTVAVGAAPKSIALGDFDQDNDLDFVTPINGGQASVRVNNGTGSFGAGSSAFTDGLDTHAVTVADFDSDGAVDLAFEVKTALDLKLIVRLNNGVGGFFSAPTGSPYDLEALGNPDGDLVVGDFNEDGVQDIASHAGSIAFGSGDPLLDGNLVVNGGAEGPNAAHGNTTAPRVPGWRDCGLFGDSVITYVRYGSPGGFPRREEGARWEGGQSFFSGGPENSDQESCQDIDLTDRSQAIDAGGATARLQADLGGYKGNNDRIRVRAEFLAENGTTETRADATIGPVTSAQRGNLTAFLRRESSALSIPAGTRSIQVTIEAIYDSGVYINGYADNVGLFLDNAPVNPPPPGPPSSGTGNTTTTPPAPVVPAQPVKKKCKKGRKLRKGKCVRKKKKRKKRV